MRLLTLGLGRGLCPAGLRECFSPGGLGGADRLAQLVTLPGCVGTEPLQFGGGTGAQLPDLACRVLAGPRGLRACVLGTGLGRGGPLPGGPGGLLMLARQLPRLVALGLGGADQSVSVGTGPLDRLPRFGGRPIRSLARGGDGGVLVRLGLSHRGVPLGGGLVDAGLCLAADAVHFGGVHGDRLGQLVLRLPRAGLRGGHVLVSLFRRGVG